MPNWEQLNFQNSNSPIMEQLIFLHDHIMSILITITWLVAYMMMILMKTKKSYNEKENHSLEVLWTFIPSLFLILIAFPSLRLLYMTEESEKSNLSMKILGHQWYWSYEYSNFSELEFDSFMVQNSNMFRLLETDNYMVIPWNSFSNLFISSSDVLHSWTIPNLNLKVDASPGRLNHLNLFNYKPGIFYGQCSEICGTNHSFMPINLMITNNNTFKNWIKSY